MVKTSTSHWLASSVVARPNQDALLLLQLKQFDDTLASHGGYQSNLESALKTQATNMLSEGVDLTALPSDQVFDDMVKNMVSVVADSKSENTNAQKAVNTAHSKVNSHFTSHVATKLSNKDSTKTDHATCRTSQESTFSTETVECNKVVSYWNALSGSNGPAVCPANTIAKLEAANSWTAGWGAGFDALVVTCKTAKLAAEDYHGATCDTKQVAFEKAWCAWKDAEKTGCEVIADQQTVYADAEDNFKHRQNVILSAKKAICFVNAIKKAETITAADVQECVDLTTSTIEEVDQISIDYPEVTHTCSDDDLNRPGTPTWKSTLYTFQKTIQDRLQEVNACPPDVVES